MKKNIIGLLVLTVFIFFGCGGGGGSSSGDDVSEGPTNNVSNENNQALSVPQNVTVTPTGISRKATAVTPYNTANEITWDAVDGAIQYNIYWLNDTPVTTATGNLIEGVTSPYIHSGLDSDPSLTYYYIVTAIGDAGEGPASNEANAVPVAKPQNVTAEAGDTTVRVRWDEVTGATSYNIYWLNATEVTTGTGTQISVAAATGRHSYTHENLTNNTGYYYIITAIDPAGEGSASAEVSAIPTAERLAAPTNISATADNTSNSISWDELHGADSYNLYWLNSTGVTAGNGNVINITPADPANPQYTHLNLTNGLAYYYIVTGVDDVGEGADSAEATATPMPPVPSAPANEVATRGNTENTITWDSVSGATSYNIYWLDSTGVTTLNGAPLTSVTSPYIHSGLTNYTDYYYIVTAVNMAGESVASAEVTATPVAPPDNVSVMQGDSSNTISWDAVSGATSYNIYWLNATGVTKGTGNSTSSATNTYNHLNLTNNLTYYYIVTAVDGVGEGTASSEVFATPIAQPSNLAVAAGNTDNVISWDTVTGATSYNLYWLENTSGVTINNGSLISGVTSPYTHSPLTNGSNCYYIITAVNATGQSPASAEVSAMPVAPPETPTTVTVTPANTVNTLTWDAMAYTTSYNIYWGTATGVTPNQITDVSSPYTHTGRSNGTEYFYIVTAENISGESAASGEVSAAPDAPLPAAPLTPAATPGNTENEITWLSVDGATSYNIYWGTTSGVTTTQITNETSPYTHTGLTNGDEIFYTVTAVNATGEGAASSEVSATPSTPTATITATPGNTSNTITWADVDGAVSYNIYWLNTTGVTPGTGNALTGVSSSYTHSNLTNGLAYYYVVTAVDGTGERSASAEVNAMPALPLPSAPANTAATPGNGSNVITWDTVDDATSYNIYWGTATGVTPTLIAGVTSPYKDSGLPNDGTEYFYIVTALNSSGEGSASSEVSAMPVDASIPENVIATAGDASNTLAWDAVTGAASYNLYWGTTTGVTPTQITGVANPYVHTPLVNDGTEYFYIVTAVDGGAAESAPSAEVSATPFGAPTAPAISLIAPGNTINTLTWNSVAGTTSYNIYWGTATGVTPNQITDVSSPYTHTGRSNGTEYFYIVTAENVSGESAASGEVSATPDAPLPAAPLNPAVTPGNTENEITWLAVDGATSYNIYWGTTSGVTTTQIANETSPYTHTGRTNGDEIFYTVTAVNATGEGPDSSEVSATPSAPTATITATPGNVSNTITWDDVASASDYNIYWLNTTGVTPGTGNAITGVSSPYTHPNLTNGLIYYYVVTAVDGTGERSASAEVNATPIAPPENVISSAGNAENVITWDGVTGATGYTISWNNSGSVAIGENLLSGVTITSPYTHSPLANDGTEYFYIVTAVNATGQSQASAEVSATPVAPPATPTNVDATAGNTINEITWDTMANATSYNIYWGTVTGVTPTQITGAASPYTHTGLTNGTQYFYIVTAENGSGESVASGEESATPNVPLPAAPLNPSATPENAENEITWNDVDGATSYNLHWGTVSGVITGTFTGATRPYTHSGLTNGIAIFYTVTAVNATGEGPASSEVSATPIAIPDIPTPVVATAANTVNTITWGDMAGATSYNIYWANATGVTTGTGTKIAGVTSPYTHSGLTNGTEYFYIVTSENSSGESAASGEVSDIPAVKLPSIPANVTATAGDTLNILIWDAVTGASSYNIYWGTATGVTTGTGTLIADIATNSHIHTGLTNGIEYFYIVTANNVTGEGLASAEASAMPIIPIPTKPVNVTATPGNTNNTIIWDESEGATSYNIYWKEAAGSVTTGDNPILGITSPYIHTGLTPGTEYYYIVTAVNATGESSTSDEVSAVVLFPRPVTDTGQTTCYDNLEELADCPTNDPVLEAFYGQDANYSINPQSYTKLDSDGNVLPFSATSWAMVRDTKTGLIWEVKTDDDGTQDKDYTYTWADAVIFVGDLNTVSFGRFTDWRLPTVKELQSIVDYSRSAPSINDVYFLNIISSPKDAHYWSSTEYAINTDTDDDLDGDTDHAWFVHFVNGYTDLSHKTMEHNVRAVRGGP